jgi:hypothetical protein
VAGATSTVPEFSRSNLFSLPIPGGLVLPLWTCLVSLNLVAGRTLKVYLRPIHRLCTGCVRPRRAEIRRLGRNLAILVHRSRGALYAQDWQNVQIGGLAKITISTASRPQFDLSTLSCVTFAR